MSFNINSALKDLKRYRRLLKQSDDRLLPVPDKWQEFAPLCKIRSGNALIPFVPYEYQKKIVDIIQSHTTTIILKSRQLGLTEVVANYALFNAIKNPAYYALFFSTTQEATWKIARRVRRSVESLGKYCKLVSNSLGRLEIQSYYGTGGTIEFRNSKSSSARGAESVSLLFFDEMAFIPSSEAEELYGATVPTQSMNLDSGKTIINSTPNTTTDFYFNQLAQGNGDRDVLEICDLIRKEEIEPIQYWSDEVLGKTAKVIVHYKCHPIYGSSTNFLRDLAIEKGLSQDHIEREYNLSFTSSNLTIFSSVLIKNCCAGNKFEKLQNLESSRGIFYCGLDPSGMGKDYTVFSVIQKIDNSYKYVYQYRSQRSNTETDIYHICEIIEAINPIAIVVETNSMGNVYFEKLLSRGYESEIIPHHTSQESKKKMIAKMLSLMENNRLHLPDDKKVINEFLKFHKDESGKITGAIEGANDDIVMSLALCCSSLTS